MTLPKDKKPRETKKKPLLASELLIVKKDDFPVLETCPVDNLSPEIYRRIERLTCWFVLRAPLTEITKLANPSLICLFKSNKDPRQGSRATNRSEFDEGFMAPLGIDCTMFDFVYSRRKMKSALIDADLDSNDYHVFDELTERCVCFVGKNEDGKEDSCIESICRHIRNGFAHGRLAVKEGPDGPSIFIEDGPNPRNVVYESDKTPGQKIEIRFRMLARLSTLERWYELLTDDKNETGDTGSNH